MKKTGAFRQLEALHKWFSQSGSGLEEVGYQFLPLFFLQPL